MSPEQEKFLACLSAFQTAARNLDHAWDYLPDEVLDSGTVNKRYPFQMDFSEVPILVQSWYEHLKMTWDLH